MLKLGTAYGETIQETAYIIGGGPSLKGFDFNRIRHKGFLLGVNDAAFVAQAHALFSLDFRWQCERKAKIQSWCLSGQRAWCVVENADKLIELAEGPTYLLREYRAEGGFTEDPRCIESSGPGGYGAINLLMHMGCKKIYLLGFDLNPCGEQHFHDGYQWRNSQWENSKYKRWVKWFEKSIDHLNRIKIEVINANPESFIQCFPKTSYDQL